MEGKSIYSDIAKRTSGSIYIGVVGPVRTGKSTFIKRFMETLVIPNIDNEYKRERARDELPQSGSGRTIMTTEPKFIPDQPVELSLAGNAAFSVRLIDCVGYIVDGSLGYIEQDAPRMVSTPWFDEPIPFSEAAEIGTKKVITDHSTIGLVVTTDGSICDIPRQGYEEPEARVVNELQAINKPFVILLNSSHPQKEETQKLKAELSKKYDVPVIAVNCMTLGQEEIRSVIETVLFEFPVREISIDMPGWLEPLPGDHWLKSCVYSGVCDALRDIHHVRDILPAAEAIQADENIEHASVRSVELGDGTANISVSLPSSFYYKVLSEVSGADIADDNDLVSLIRSLRTMKKDYDRICGALSDVRTNGYGIVMPSIDEMTLEEPEIVKQGGRFGVRLRASAPSIHMIRADIQTEVSPIVGSERQSEELVEFLMKDFESDPASIWQANFFGKTLHEMVNEGLHNKLWHMPQDARFKLQETLQKIINEGSGGLICIIL